MLTSLFPPMSAKDRLMGWVFMFAWGCCAYLPALVGDLVFGTPIIRLAFPSPTLFSLTLAFLWGSTSFLWLYVMAKIGLAMVTKTPRQGFRPGDLQPWKHNGGWE